ncbi:DUF551 domain-containing protein [Bacteroides faecis]|jgi:hypothetical protein|uniref:DUF551 domain-containing protein n=1 Tax=Bacteroides faecis TaxID=674529 RepID=A0ABY5T9W7_9BACE|nr:DUF551 domain-containing protein [Bacteroides faecis]UVQ73272.1 DUF551 domain-containing protein [Bacteroides faecis]DAS69140.1 MAG TPA: Protein of unknown function (DUF551) [Caudoviricetes sp.]
MNKSIEKAFEESWLNDYYHGNYKTHAQVGFYAGAVWQSNQMAWINVNDKMPEDGIEVDERTILAHTKEVIVLYKNGFVGKGKRIYMDNKKRWQWSCLKSEDITHWMFIPIN